MNCHELRLYFEDSMRVDAKYDVEAEHLARCEECVRFVEKQQELGAGLRLARMSVPKVPASLDGTVLANYRRQIAERRLSARTAPHRRLVMLCWSAAAAAIVLVAALLMFSARENPATVSHDEPAPAAKAPLPVASAARAVRPPLLPQKRSHQPQSYRAEPSNVVLTGSLPPDFRSLIYCDELSCSGPMDVIRMQLPASSVMFVPGSNSDGGIIVADVLVGSDGIARGIRIVQ